jgi:hypothetical protein
VNRPTIRADVLEWGMLLQSDLPEPFVHTGSAPRWAAIRAVEKVPHGLREIHAPGMKTSPRRPSPASGC